MPPAAMAVPVVESCCAVPLTGVYGVAPAFNTPPPLVVTVLPLATKLRPGAKPAVSVRV